MDSTKETKSINYYKMEQVDAAKIKDSFNEAVASIEALKIADDVKSDDFVRQVFEQDAVASLLILLSRLPVFDKDFANALSHDLELLALAKKLKYYTDLTLSQDLLLLKQVMQCFGKDVTNYQIALSTLVRNTGQLASLRFKGYVKEKKVLSNNDRYEENNEALVTIDPHAVYPTSIYRHCDSLTLATSDSRTIEAVMSTTLTTTIKITKGVLEPTNRILADVYQPLGRCVALIDDKVVRIYGKKLEDYFNHHGVELIQLIHRGNEVDKDIKNVEQILVELKNNAVARNEPVLIMGGGVIHDIGGFATALYYRNTPYIMLCTTVVTGIDAGPSPRTCCDGFQFKNLYGAYHPPVLTITDRTFWKSLHEGWIRHGIAEIIKMAVVKDKSLFELVEQAGPRLITTKFGTEGDVDAEFEKLCDLIVGKALEGYVRCEYGNLWETHQSRPHAYGHTWSNGYELPSGMLHGHAVATCMGYGAYLAKLEQFITEEEFRRILKLLSDMELSLWHDIMDNHDLLANTGKKVQKKRGGNLCAPVPKKLGQFGFINKLSREELDRTLDEYKNICQEYPRAGRGVQVHCREVGLQNPSAVAGDILNDIADIRNVPIEQPKNYQEWIEEMQKKRNDKWELDIQFTGVPDTPNPPNYNKFSLFQDGAEKYAIEQTSLASKNVQKVARLTGKMKLFEPCMIGALESQFLKMQCLVKGAKRCLDVGTFTGMSAISMAEGIPEAGKVVTIELYPENAKAAQKAFDQSDVGKKIELHVARASDVMRKLQADGEKFDVIFIDADKESYLEYYELAVGGLLAKDGIILADNSLGAILYDKADMRSQKLHEFNQFVKNDKRVEQVVLTIREGLTLIRMV